MYSSLYKEVNRGQSMDYFEYELQVKNHFEKLLKKSLSINVSIDHQKNLQSSDGQNFNIDLSYSFRIAGADYLTIIECKCWRDSVSREKVLELNAKKDILNAHKAILVTTVGFQRGAIEYANSKKIGLYKIVESGSLQEISHFIGNYLYFKEKLSELSFLRSGVSAVTGIGVISVQESLSTFLKNRFDINFTNECYEAEKFDLIAGRLSTIPLDWDREYVIRENCGLDLILDNEREIRKFSALILLSQQQGMP